MANEIFKELKTRIALKQNTYDYWVNGEGKDYIPLYGEVCFCEIPAGSDQATNAPTVLFKVGTAKKDAEGAWIEGTNKTFAQLNWVSALAADVYGWAKKTETDFIAWVNTVVEHPDPTVDTNTEYRIVKVDEFNYKLQSKAATDADTAWADVEGSTITIPEPTKVETSEQNGYIKVGGEEVKVYELPELTTDDIIGIDGYKTKQEAYTAEGAVTKTVTKVEQDANGEVVVTYGDIAFPDATVVTDSETNGNIVVDGEEVKVFDDVFKAEGTTVVAAGGIAAGSTVNGKTFQQILYNMMYPYQKPTISAAASPNGGTYMKGNKQTITSVTATVTKKTEEIQKVELYNGSTLVATKNGDDTISSSSTALVKNGGKVVFEGLSREVSANGGQYKAKVYDITGGTAEASTGSFSFINPYYYGVCGASATLDEALVEGLTKDLSGKASKTYSYTTNSQRMVIAYPSSYGKIKLVKDGNGLDNTNAFGSPVTVNITNEYGVAEDYYVYANGVTSGSAKMTFSY